MNLRGQQVDHLLAEVQLPRAEQRVIAPPPLGDAFVIVQPCEVGLKVGQPSTLRPSTRARAERLEKRDQRKEQLEVRAKIRAQRNQNAATKRSSARGKATAGKAGPKGKTVAAPKGTDIVPDDPMDDA